MKNIHIDTHYRNLIIPVSKDSSLFDIGRFCGLSEKHISQCITALYPISGAPIQKPVWQPDGREHVMSVQYYDPEHLEYLVTLPSKDLEVLLATLTKRAGVYQRPEVVTVQIPAQIIVPKYKRGRKRECINFALVRDFVLTALMNVYGKTAPEIEEVEILLPAQIIAQLSLTHPFTDTVIWNHEGSIITVRVVDGPFKERYYEQLHSWSLGEDKVSIIGESLYASFQYRSHSEIRITIDPHAFDYASQQAAQLSQFEMTFLLQFFSV